MLKGGFSGDQRGGFGKLWAPLFPFILRAWWAATLTDKLRVTIRGLTEGT